MRPERRTIRRCLVLAVLVAPYAPVVATPAGDYRFVCPDEGTAASIVDVLQASGQQGQFISFLRSYDPEGFAILADPALADKTVWAPTDTAFAAVADRLDAMSDSEIMAILGYHISPPRRAPGGSYPIVTFDLLFDAGEMTHRTRTGVLSGSDVRTQTTTSDGVLMVEEARVLETAWCTAAGSVFSIDAVITEVDPPSTVVWLLRRAVRILLYEDIRFVIYSTVGAAVIGSVIARLLGRRKRRDRAETSREA